MISTRFNPKPSMLESIDFDQSNPPCIEIFNTYRFDTKEEDAEGTARLEKIRSMFIKKYEDRYTAEHSHQTLYLFHEMLKNSVEYGNQFDCKKYAIVAIWFGEFGALFGIRDEGDFYGRQDVKESLEARKAIP